MVDLDDVGAAEEVGAYVPLFVDGRIGATLGAYSLKAAFLIYSI